MKELIEKLENRIARLESYMDQNKEHAEYVDSELHDLKRRTQALSPMPERANCPHCGKIVSLGAKRCGTCSKPI